MADFPYAQTLTFLSAGGSGTSTDVTDADPATSMTLPAFGRYGFDLSGDYTAEAIIGIRVEIDATGTGGLFWTLTFDEPTGTHFFDVQDGEDLASKIVVNGPTSYVHVVTATDVHFDPDGDFSVAEMVVRIANSATYKHGYGSLESWDAGPIQVTRFAIIAFTADQTQRLLRAPALRQLQRGGTGGIGGIPRAVGNPTRQASPRRGSGTVL